MTAIATSGAATGLDVVDDGNAYVYVGGNVYAKATDTAQGAHIVSAEDTARAETTPALSSALSGGDGADGPSRF